MPKLKISLFTFAVFFLILAIEPSVYLLLIIAAAALHELGHIIVLVLCKVPIKRIIICPLGIDIQRGEGLVPYKAEILISLGGIFINVITMLICLKFTGIYANYFFICNFSFAALNILPIKTLDGGEALESTLLLFMPPESAGKVINILSFIFVIALWVFAVWLLFITGYNFTLLFLSVYLFAVLWLKK